MSILHEPEAATLDPDMELATGALHGLGCGVAIANPDTLAILFENARFRQWFPGAPDDTLEGRLTGLDEARLRARITHGRPYRYETEMTHGPRATPLLVELRCEPITGNRLLLVEAYNITKQKEAEFMLDSYSTLMERQARALEQEKERAERLLLNIMPATVAAELRDFGTTTPQSFDSASVLMLDFVGFTDKAIAHDPAALIAELNDVFTSFDRIVEHCRAERLKTIGDAYMAVAGMPEPDPDHAFNIARAALRMRRFLERRNRSAPNRWLCRIGIGVGPAIGSIVGVQRYVYDVFGPAVNLAARLQAAAEPMQILITEQVADRIRDEFVVRYYGAQDLKGFGRQELYLLEEEARKGR